MSNQISAQLSAPGVAKIAELLQALNDQDRDLRLIQARNAPAAKYLRNFSAVATLQIAEAQSGAEIFSGVSIFFFTSSGGGMYSIMGGQNPTASIGIEIPAGGAQIEIQGHANIAAFQALAVGGTFTGAYVLFV